MKILFAADTYPPNINGAALATQRIAIELKKRGNDVYIIAPSTKFKSFNKVEEGNLPVFRIRSILLQRSQQFRIAPQALLLREIRKIVKDVDPDIIHINNPGFIGQSAIKIGRKMNYPLVGTSHFMPENIVHYLRLPDMIENVVNSIVWKVYARIYNNLDAIISPTPTAGDILEKLHLRPEIHVISNGLDLEEFNPGNDGKYLKKQFNLPDKTTLIFVGRIDKEKCLDVFIKAVSMIKNLKSFHVVIVGKGKELNSLKDLASKLGVTENITFTGFIPYKDLANIYKIGDIFVMPGIAELQSLVTMEAMATGLPVVGANAVALPHLIKNDKNGFLFIPNDPNDLAKKLLILLKNKKLRENMGKEGMMMIQKHDINSVIDETEKIYRKLISNYKKRKDK